MCLPRKSLPVLDAAVSVVRGDDIAGRIHPAVATAAVAYLQHAQRAYVRGRVEGDVARLAAQRAVELVRALPTLPEERLARRIPSA